MKKRFYKAFTILLSAIFLSGCFLFGCNNASSASYKFLDIDEINIELPNGGGELSLNSRYLSADAAYYFDDTTDSALRNPLIKKTEAIIKFIRLTNVVNIYFSKNITENGFKTGEVFLSENCKETDIIIQAIMADRHYYAPYGIVYGISAYVCDKLGYGLPDIKSEDEVISYLKNESNYNVTDLEYPLFDTRYATAEQKEYAQSFACLTVKNYLEKGNPLNTLALFYFGETKNGFINYVNGYLSQNDIDYIFADTTIKYEYFNKQYPLKIETENIEHYFVNGFKDLIFNIEPNYSQIKEFVIKEEQSMAFVRSYFPCQNDGVTKNYFDQNFMPEYIDEYVGYTTICDNEATMQCRSFGIFLHEYTHSVMFRTNFNRLNVVAAEGLASYFEAFSYYNKLFVYAYYKLTNYYIKGWTEIYREFNAIYDNNLGASDFEGFDVILWYHCAAKRAEMTPETNKASRNSFCSFLADNYGGVEKLIELNYGGAGDFYAVYKKTYNSLLQEWQSFLAALII